MLTHNVRHTYTTCTIYWVIIFIQWKISNECRICENFLCKIKFGCKKFSQTLPVSEKFSYWVFPVWMLAVDEIARYTDYTHMYVYTYLSCTLRIGREGKEGVTSCWLSRWLAHSMLSVLQKLESHVHITSTHIYIHIILNVHVTLLQSTYKRAHLCLLSIKCALFLSSIIMLILSVQKVCRRTRMDQETRNIKQQQHCVPLLEWQQNFLKDITQKWQITSLALCLVNNNTGSIED